MEIRCEDFRQGLRRVFFRTLFRFAIEKFKQITEKSRLGRCIGQILWSLAV